MLFHYWASWTLYYCGKSLIKKNLGSKGFTWLRIYRPSSWKDRQELETGTQRQELKQRPWRNAAYCLAPLGLMSYFSYTTWTGMAQPILGWALAHQLAVKKMLFTHAHRPFCWRQFLSGDAFFPGAPISEDKHPNSCFLRVLPSIPSNLTTPGC